MEEKPAVKEGQVVRMIIRQGLSVDHRIVDGAVAASFLQSLNTTATYIPHPPPDLPLERGGIGKTSMKVRKTHKIPSPSGGGLGLS